LRRCLKEQAADSRPPGSEISLADYAGRIIQGAAECFDHCTEVSCKAPCRCVAHGVGALLASAPALLFRFIHRRLKSARGQGRALISAGTEFLAKTQVMSAHPRQTSSRSAPALPCQNARKTVCGRTRQGGWRNF